MNHKTRIILIIAAVILFFLGFLLGKVPIGNRSAKSSEGASKEDAGGQNVPEGIAVVSHTMPEMLSADYWIGDSSEELLFSAEDIEDFNDNNPSFVLYYDSGRGKDVKLFMDDLPDILSREMVTSLLNKGIPGQMKPRYINGEKADGAYWDAISANCDYDSVPETIMPVYAVCLDRVVAKILPCEDFASEDPDEVFCNDFVSAELMPFTGAVIIHESRDGEWYYVIYGSICGWVRKEYLAVCKDKEEWINCCNPENYLMVTARELILDETAVSAASSRMILPMGTKIRLSSDSPDQVNGRMTLGCYIVDIPLRDDSGGLIWEKSLVPVSEDVHVGPLPMTSEAVLRQSFKFLGHVYGWGGSLSSNDCSGMVRQVYGCFGFNFPRNATAIAKLCDMGSFDSADMTKAKKMELLKQMPAGTLLYMDGHIMTYLGLDEELPYVISSCATYIDPEKDPSSVNKAYCVFVSGLDLTRMDETTWLESLRYMQWRQY